ncbi:3-hydroxybutyrate dehydrogenase [Alteromonas stellipolaris]|jgi:3-hydroxybutyrate dehydrogenase|uniref:3-hydroxybutyrate dehydrogenase n=1 Tax=Alteromonas stellipolaris TaxID=233316 RepID=A0AAW7Z6S4_9ALTE|nr:3-hydroxybutyrate dehydrogenase [Alteromonas stellipolaris]ALM91125.1 D-beta-hydroxybutyrate dehydrogenase [Alteromonas stellipolaris LMG 21856]AMJ74133.1 3-hydroxybutyrate dehydrogenase [Alteromonas stellipolaris]AMJ94268.1 3-hydroxybutyrate dehydrogenase [Alteromonas stellipolaris]MBZ2163001.1 3-hydroxybutyrate dehydrogenase [Alteromonas stellipolaris]MDO6536682.1 3-hydroxybutyrate dehydrogenase [Alteromonas stellipolaris]
MTKRTVFITGGASGIGFGIAQAMSKTGHHVIIADINEQAAQHAASDILKEGGSASATEVDVCNAKQVAALPDLLEGQKVDVLINNAGIQHVSRIEDFPSEKWQQLINIMLVGPALLTQAFLPGMREQNFGRIINIGSIHSLVASPYKSAYVAAKHGLLGFAKTIALETGDCDVTINTLCPAYVKTPLVEKQIASQAKENNLTEEEVINKIMLEPMPKKQFISVDELADTAAFLMSDSARNITGQTMVLDGGWTAR